MALREFQDSKGRFTKGNVANPAGRTPIADGGKPNAVKQARELIEAQLVEVIQSVIDQSIKGDTSAAKLIVGLVMPQLKSQELTVNDLSKLPRLVVETNVIDAIEADVVEPSKESPERIADKRKDRKP